MKISLQLDKATDAANCSQLIALVRYIHNGVIMEDFLFFEELKITTKGKDIFQRVKDFFVKFDLDIQIIDYMCTNNSPYYARKWISIFGTDETRDSALVRYPLFSSLTSFGIKNIASKCKRGQVKTFNWIRLCALNHCLFKLLRNILEVSILVFHMEVYWLSHGRAFTCFFELQ